MGFWSVVGTSEDAEVPRVGVTFLFFVLVDLGSRGGLDVGFRTLYPNSQTLNPKSPKALKTKALNPKALKP